MRYSIRGSPSTMSDFFNTYSNPSGFVHPALSKTSSKHFKWQMLVNNPNNKVKTRGIESIRIDKIMKTILLLFFLSFFSNYLFFLLLWDCISYILPLILLKPVSTTCLSRDENSWFHDKQWRKPASVIYCQILRI